MDRTKRFKPFRSFDTFREINPFHGRKSLFILGLTACFAVVTLGVTIAPSISATIDNFLVGDYADFSILPTGKVITPTAAKGATFEPLSTDLRADGTADANGAVATTS